MLRSRLLMIMGPVVALLVASAVAAVWLLQALHDYLEGRLADHDFHETADDAVRLAVEAQLRAGVDVVTDGEQRRDSYASFVGGRLDNCQLIPITDLLPYVDFDVTNCVEAVRRVRPGADVLEVSATHGDGLDGWYDWLRAARTG